MAIDSSRLASSRSNKNEKGSAEISKRKRQRSVTHVIKNHTFNSNKSILSNSFDDDMLDGFSTNGKDNSITNNDKIVKLATPYKENITRVVSQYVSSDECGDEGKMDFPSKIHLNGNQNVSFHISKNNICDISSRVIKRNKNCVNDAVRDTMPSKAFELKSIKHVLRPELASIYRHKGHLDQHLKCLRIEDKMNPLHSILSRLMSHSLNKRGIFNTPVNISLFPEYLARITPNQPMDLGTVKSRLHALYYVEAESFFFDASVVFTNAMAYNPIGLVIHECASELLKLLESDHKKYMKNNIISSSTAFISTQEQSRIGSPRSITAVQDSNCCFTADSTDIPDLKRESVSPQLSGNFLNSSGSTIAVLPKPSNKYNQKMPQNHSCSTCKGRSCSLCTLSCRLLESSLIVCSGLNGCGQRVRKNASYYISADASRIYCQKCYPNLGAILPFTRGSDEEEVMNGSSTMKKRTKVKVLYKRDLLKRSNTEEIVEKWVECSVCVQPMHEICALYNRNLYKKKDQRGSEVELCKFICPSCTCSISPKTIDVGEGHANRYVAHSLPKCSLGNFVEGKIRSRMMDFMSKADAEQFTVRVTSNLDTKFSVPDEVKRHFILPSRVDGSISAQFPKIVPYTSKTMLLFQTIDGVDVCLFCMFVQEFDSLTHGKRVYIAYLDSADHFRPRHVRTHCYQEMLISYLAYAKTKGFTHAHIWSCPPIRGNSFVFWCHPAQQRTPTKDMLIKWYHNIINRAIKLGIVEDVKSLYEECFEDAMENIDGDILTTCPPLFDGDHWIDEAVRLNQAAIARLLKASKANGSGEKFLVDGRTYVQSDANIPSDSILRLPPTIQCADLLHDIIMPHPLAFAFRRPVNAAALNLKDYHNIIAKPIDLGTIHAYCTMGHYSVLDEMLEDVDLCFRNAVRYNPPNNVVHQAAVKLRDFFCSEMGKLMQQWGFASGHESDDYGRVYMRLDSFSSCLKERISTKDDKTSASYVKTKLSSEMNCHNRFAYLYKGGTEAIACSMVGKDVNMFDSKHLSLKCVAPNKKKNPKKKLKCETASILSSSQNDSFRNYAWLWHEVADTTRNMRTDFFVCTLNAQSSKNKKDISDETSKIWTDAYETYKEYIGSIQNDDTTGLRCKGRTIGSSSRLTDVRSSLLDFFQHHSYQFDSLRNAKHSSTMLLYNLHNPDSKIGWELRCSKCSCKICDVRWHKVVQNSTKVNSSNCSKTESCGEKSELGDFSDLCVSCYATVSNVEEYTPLQILV